MRWINKAEARQFARRHYGLDRNDGAVAVCWVLGACAIGAAIGAVLWVWR